MVYKRKIPRECRVCKVPRPISGEHPDPCLGWLPGVEYACCGHGSDHGYVSEKDSDNSTVVIDGVVVRDCLRGAAARVRMRELGGNPPEPDDPTRVYSDLNWAWPRTDR